MPFSTTDMTSFFLSVSILWSILSDMLERIFSGGFLLFSHRFKSTSASTYILGSADGSFVVKRSLMFDSIQILFTVRRGGVSGGHAGPPPDTITFRLLACKVTIITGRHLLCGSSSWAGQKVANCYAGLPTLTDSSKAKWSAARPTYNSTVGAAVTTRMHADSVGTICRNDLSSSSLTTDDAHRRHGRADRPLGV